MRRGSILILLAAFGCERGSTSAATSAERPREPGVPSGPSGGSVGSVQPAIAGEPGDAEVLKRLCKEATCAGPFSSIEVYRGSEGKPQVYVFSGDLQRCSHPPTSYFDATGRKILVQANKPVVPGSSEAKRFEDERKKLLAGLKQAESHSCSKLPK